MRKLEYNRECGFTWEVSRHFIAEATFNGLVSSHPFNLDRAWEEIWKQVCFIVKYV